jgi:hypothetical protein
MFSPRFSVSDFGSVWKQCVGFFNELVGEEPSALRMRVSPLATNFDGLPIFLTENQRKVVRAPRPDGTNPRDLEDLLEFQPQRFLLLGLDPDTFNAVTWVTSQFGGPTSN